VTRDSGDAPLVATLSRTIDEALDPLVPRGARCALIDFPAYSNVGDSLIWLGERAYLHRRGARIVYACQISNYSRRELARRLGDGLILLRGGGNLGDLWPHHQRLREQVIGDFPDARIVQLSQSIHFRDRNALTRSSARFSGHRHLTLLARDAASLALAREELGVAATLCPDMSFALGPLARLLPPARDILWLARSDQESASGPLPPLGVTEERTDWVEEAPSLAAWLSQIRVEQMARHPRVLGWLAGPGLRLYDVLARQRVTRGRATLGRGRVVVTDRLHGHILAVLMGIPHVLLDNSYGKVSGVLDLWTKSSVLTTWAKTPAEALERARELARTAPRGRA
jgi:pyruvyl transferase EpsO